MVVVVVVVVMMRRSGLDPADRVTLMSSTGELGRMPSRASTRWGKVGKETWGWLHSVILFLLGIRRWFEDM